MKQLLFLLGVCVTLAIVCAQSLAAQSFSFPSCSELRGSWKQAQFNDRDYSKESRTFVITKISASCDFEGTFGSDHTMTGTISTRAGGGDITITRTINGCTNHLYGKIYQVASSAYATGGLNWEITSSEPGCGMGSDHHEKRFFKHQ